MAKYPSKHVFVSSLLILVLLVWFCLLVSYVLILCYIIGNIIEAVRHVRSVMGDIRRLANMDDDEVFSVAKNLGAPYDLVMQTKQLGRLPVVQFAAGGVATPADAALMMQLGCDGVFVGSGVFKSGDPARRARAIVQAVTHYTDPKVLAEVSCGLGEAMVGLNLDKNVERYANRSE